MNNQRCHGAGHWFGRFSGLLCLIVTLAFAGNTLAQERGGSYRNEVYVSGVIQEMEPSSRLLVISGRRYNLASTVTFDGLRLEAARVMELLSPELTIQVILPRQGSDVIVGINSGLL